MYKLTKPSIAMLPMDDIKKELEYHPDDNQDGFTRKDDNANDTDNVAGVDSDQIAVSFGPDQEGNPRSTVRNAMFLDEKNADYFARQDDLAVIEEQRGVTLDELASLRDELYQLKSAVVKTGAVQDYSCEMGFTDSFSNRDIKYIQGHVAEGWVVSDGGDRVETGDLSLFKKEQWIVLANKNDRHKHKLFRIKNIAEDESTLIMESSIGLLELGNDDEVFIYNSLGEYWRRAFSFAGIEEKPLGSIETIGLKDRTESDWREGTANTLTIDKTGYAYRFRADLYTADPGTELALTKISIKAKKIGSPSPLLCTLIHMGDMERYNNHEVITEYSAMADEAWKPNIYSFEFDNVPMLLNGEEYLIIITAQNPAMLDINNTWDFEMLPDAQGHNTLFEVDGSGLVYENPDTREKDLFHVIYVREIDPAKEAPFREGLYSATFELSHQKKIGRCRVSLRTKKEEDLTLDKVRMSGAIPDGEEIHVAADVNVRNAYLSPNVNYIINGEYVRKAIKDSDMIVTEKGWYVDPQVERIPIQRMACNVQLLAYAKSDTQEDQFLGVISDFEPIMVVPEFKKSDVFSERVVYETRVEDEVMQQANKFMLQVTWTGISISDNIIPGAIHELVVSFLDE